MRPPRADLAGFADAQQRLRDELGETVVFYADPVVTFPPGTPLDPETGVPFDPTVTATSSAAASATARCSVALDIKGQQLKQSAAGIDDVTHVVLITGSGAAASLTDMTEFDLHDERYKITAQKPDVRWLARWLIFGRRR